LNLYDLLISGDDHLRKIRLCRVLHLEAVPTWLLWFLPWPDGSISQHPLFWMIIHLTSSWFSEPDNSWGLHVFLVFQ
jgi:hypothetical protein